MEDFKQLVKGKTYCLKNVSEEMGYYICSADGPAFDLMWKNLIHNGNSREIFAVYTNEGIVLRGIKRNDLQVSEEEVRCLSGIYTSLPLGKEGLEEVFIEQINKITGRN